MFDLSAKRHAWIAVTWPGLVQREAGGLAEPTSYTIDVRVELVERDKLDALNDSYAPLPGDEPVEGPAARDKRAAIELAAFLALADDWRGVMDGDRAVPFSPDAASRMIRIPGFVLGFNTAYANALAGVVETREKNSDASPATGPAGA